MSSGLESCSWHGCSHTWGSGLALILPSALLLTDLCVSIEAGVKHFLKHTCLCRCPHTHELPGHRKGLDLDQETGVVSVVPRRDLEALVSCAASFGCSGLELEHSKLRNLRGPGPRLGAVSCGALRLRAVTRRVPAI